MLLVVGVTAALVAILVGWLASRRIGSGDDLPTAGNTLLVTAHPDDECMFFAPMLLALRRARERRKSEDDVFLLCLSNGNYYGEGEARKEELVESAVILGIPASNIQVIDDKLLPDSPNVDWGSDVIGRYVLQTVERHTIKQIVTFDEGGVSRHSNHIAISQALRSLLENEELLKVRVREVLMLETTNVVRKYASCLDVLWSIAHQSDARLCVVAGPASFLEARRAMQAHQSQYLWFRRLYVTFSRYMWVNTYTRVPCG